MFQAGISRVPEYHKFLMQPNDQWYAIVASDGIWDPWLNAWPKFEVTGRIFLLGEGEKLIISLTFNFRAAHPEIHHGGDRFL